MLNSLHHLFEHHTKFHPNIPNWGDSGDMVTIHRCFCCGLNLINSEGKYKTLVEEQEEEILSNVQKGGDLKS